MMVLQRLTNMERVINGERGEKRGRRGDREVCYYIYSNFSKFYYANSALLRS